MTTESYNVYLLQCGDGSIYATASYEDTPSCLARHNAGKGTPHTKGRLPVQLLWSLHDIKGWWRAVGTVSAILELTRQSKLKLANGDREALDRVVCRGETISQALANAHEGSSPRSETDAEGMNGEAIR
jgi:predicted GIY-YIG superfamily endonuclease